ncbi:ead/Ea22-like family protein [Pseudomonas sp. 21LCFQ02]|uniref:ead/Ea22-like family protein n=1 Tax=Pseudomonas sp. 21LCFQ02 TaxID=2957505 RepID=UPI00209B328D|nr:ead/Ea22-like family protein [Pseudomonas sp. 21LCFQ02]MCO8166857.1 ead/Ea22-like family protein [Pseudomonas sp. 21LCFQ02]
MTIDKNRLKALAEAATPGRHYDRLDSAGGGIKYECKGDDGSLVLKVDHKNDEFGFVGDNGEADEAFFLACTPAKILALLGEIERLERKNANQVESIREYQDLAAGGERLGELRADLRVTKGERDELKAENEKFDEGMRSLAFQLSAGGYNAETLTAEQLVGKVTDGLASFAESSGRLLDQVRAERDALRSQVATLQAEPNSYQSGYDAGRAAEKAHADNWRAEAEGMRKDAERYRALRVPTAEKIGVSSPFVLDALVDAAIAREQSHD